MRNDRNLKAQKKKVSRLRRRRSRLYMQGGGVMVYIRSGILCKTLAESKLERVNETEFIILELTIESGQRFLVAAVYRRPKGLVLSTFFKLFYSYFHLYSNVILLGDLNADLLCSSTASNYFYTESLKNLINDYGLYNVPFGATHHSTSPGTWLDVALVDSSDKILTFEKSMVPFICNHDYLIVDYKVESLIFNKRSVCTRDFRRFDSGSFSVQLKLQIESSSFSTYLSQDPNLLLDQFQTIALRLLDEQAPFTMRTIRKNPAPWFDNVLRRRCKERDKLYRKAKLMASPSLKLKYRILRKELKKDIRVARESFIANKLQNTVDPSKKWSLLHKIGAVGKRLSSPLEVFAANELNAHYASVATVHPLCSVAELDLILSIPLNTNEPVFDVAEFDYVQVFQAATAALPKCRGRSFDRLQLSYFKDCLGIVSKFMTEIYNTSLVTGIYPQIWKKAIIIPLRKGSKIESPSDTRPIANLSHFAKIFDRLVTSQLIEYLEINNLLSPYQSGFRKYYSTQSALVKITDDIRMGIDKGLVTILLLFDFKKAFDTVKHSTLLRVMREKNCSDRFIKWFFSYLSGRSQAILDMRGLLSEFVKLTSGIPQGSNPGPVAFLILINSIVSCLDYCAESCMLFADDFQVYLQCKRADIPVIVQRLSLEAENVADWADRFDLELNFSKIVAIIFGSDQMLMRIDVPTLPQIVIRGHKVKFANSIKNLGLTLTSNLSWNAQISQITSRVHGELKRLRFRANFLSINLKKQLVTALIFPHFDYCCIAFCDLPGYLNLKLQRLQNYLVRFIFRLRKDAALQPFFKRLSWLSVFDRRKFFIFVFTYKLFTTEKPNYLLSLFPKPKDDLRRSKRTLTAAVASSFDLPTPTTSTFENSFSYQAMILWDTIPCKIRLKPSLSTFKSAMYEYLLNLSTNIDED